MYVNFVTYYVIVIPLGYYFAFHCKFVINGDKPLGLVGIWLGFVLGLLHQIIMYTIMIKRSDWQLASKKA